MAAAACKDCGRRPKMTGHHRCVTCWLRVQPIGVQVAASRRRLGMVPPELRVKRGKKIIALAPAHTSWCAGCQSFRDLEDFAKGVTKCRPCASAKSHEAMIGKIYGLTGDDYETLLALQDGKCAICRARPRSKRLAVDHDHKSGAVRGLLCSRCNHDLMGSAWDSIALVVALWHYLNTPPASGAWLPPEKAPKLGILENAQRLSNAPDPLSGVVVHGGPAGAQGVSVASAAADSCPAPHYLPVGSEGVPGKPGLWRYFVEANGEAAAPY